jgi:hypothetical protein
MTEKRLTNEELEEEARRWDARELTPAGWEDAPDAAPRANESIQINIRLPRRMVAILKEFARRYGIGYQVLMKRWLDERIGIEHKLLRANLDSSRGQEAATRLRVVLPIIGSQAASFDPPDDMPSVPSDVATTKEADQTPKAERPAS